jgi:hypothetical protein
VRLIFLDNGYSASNEIFDGVRPFIVDQPQLKWLDSQLKASDSDIEILFMHIPLPYGKPETNMPLTEPMSDYTGRGKFYNLFSVLENNSSAQLVFAGHKHINSINSYIMRNGKKLTQVMTGAFGYDRNNWRVIKITDNKILISYPGRAGTEYTISFK